MGTALAVSAVIGAVVGTASLTRSGGPVYLYFAIWLAFVPVGVLLALGAALVGSAPVAASAEPSGGARATDPRWAPVLVACAAVTAGLTVSSALATRPIAATTGSGPWPPGMASTIESKQRTVRDTQALTRAARAVLRPGDRRVGFTIGSSGEWPYVAGIVLGLDERGVQSTVGPAAWQVYFGHERAAGPSVSVAFWVGPAASAPVRGSVIAELDGVVLSYTRPNA
jgi:hypothetical protein